MAPKDYVARGRSAKKAEPQRQPLPWLRIIITLALIAGFVGFLLTIKGNAPATQTQKADSKQTAVDEEPLPEFKESEWGFPTSLSKEYKEDELPSGEKLTEMAASDKRYIMQCGSFRRQQQAEEMEARIGFQGLNAQVRATDGKNGRWYRVYLGPYQQKRQAEVDRAQIKKAGILTCQIWLWDL